MKLACHIKKSSQFKFRTAIICCINKLRTASMSPNLRELFSNKIFCLKFVEWICLLIAMIITLAEYGAINRKHYAFYGMVFAFFVIELELWGVMILDKRENLVDNIFTVLGFVSLFVVGIIFLADVIDSESRFIDMFVAVTGIAVACCMFAEIVFMIFRYRNETNVNATITDTSIPEKS